MIAAGRKIEMLGDQTADRFVGDRAGAKVSTFSEIGLRAADDVGELDLESIGETGSHDVSGDVAPAYAAERSTFVGPCR